MFVEGEVEKKYILMGFMASYYQEINFNEKKCLLKKI